LRHIEALVAQLTLPLHREDGRAADDEKLLEFLQLQDSFEWNGTDAILFKGLTSSVSTTTEFFGSIDCERNK
jgi:hypothetical protein